MATCLGRAIIQFTVRVFHGLTFVCASFPLVLRVGRGI